MSETPPPDSAELRRAERRYEVEVRRNLTRNYLAHLMHGMLGQTGFRLVNAPTFMPAYLLLLGGSDIAVGLGLALQSAGMMLTPLWGASLIEHRPRVLPVAFTTGSGMRFAVLAIGLSGLLLPPATALWAVLFFMALLGVFSGAQGVIFNVLMAKVIPVNKRGRLTGWRNFLAGIISALVAWIAGSFLVGSTPDAEGYSWTFVLAFVLTSIGMLCLIPVVEPTPPTLRPKQPLRERMRDLPRLLRDDRPFTRYVVARSIATMGRMAMPFYILYEGSRGGLDGTTLGVLTIAFTLAGTGSNLLWGALSDRHGFRLTFLLSIVLWVISTLALFIPGGGLGLAVVVFVGIGAAVQGFQNASMNLTLEFGLREDLPLRIAIANTASEAAGTVGPLLGGLLATAFGYPAVFVVSMVFLLAGGVVVNYYVPEPRAHRQRRF
jgi:MFS family permease